MDLVKWRKCANFATTKFNIMKIHISIWYLE